MPEGGRGKKRLNHRNKVRGPGRTLHWRTGRSIAVNTEKEGHRPILGCETTLYATKR